MSASEEEVNKDGNSKSKDRPDLNDDEGEAKTARPSKENTSEDVMDDKDKKKNKQKKSTYPNNSLGQMMGNPYVNFLRDYRLTFGYSGHELVKKAARHWDRMPQSQRWLYSPEVYCTRYANLIDCSGSDVDLSSDSDSLMFMSDDEGSEEFLRTPSKENAQNQGNGCPEVGKKPVCKPKRKPASCKPKRKKRGCKPKPKPRCPKRKKRACKPKPKCPKLKKRPRTPKPKPRC